MKKNKTFLVFLFLLASLVLLYFPLLTARADAELKLNPICQIGYERVKVNLPPDFVAKMKSVVEFAFQQRAAFSVSMMDLNHFHLLTAPTIENINMILEKTKTGWNDKAVLYHIQISKGILLHSQEYFKATGHAHKKNILLNFEKGAPEILDPLAYGKKPPDYAINLVEIAKDGYYYINQACLFDITGEENAFKKENQNMFKAKSLLSKERTILIRFLK